MHAHRTILLTGASGFVGAAILRALLERGCAVHALVNRKPLGVDDPRVVCFAGGLFDAAAVDRAAQGCDAVIHVVGIILERPRDGVTFRRIHVDGTRAMTDAARRAGIARYVQMSALGTRPAAPAEYHRTKHQAELVVRDSGLDWTILRPSLIHGPEGEFMRMAAAWARGKAAPFLFMPYFGGGPLGLGGAGLLQPVYVEDVARAFVEALDNAATIGRAYDLGGPDRLTWPQLHRLTAEAVVGRRRAVVPIPAWYARLLTRIVPASLLPFNASQVTMSQEDNAADLAPFIRDFGWTPRPFAPLLREYAGRL